MIPPMAQVSDTDREAAQTPAQVPAQAPARHRHRRPAATRQRGLEIAGLVLGMAAAVGVAVGWLIPSLRQLSGPPPVNRPSVAVQDSPGSSGSPGSPKAPDPAALDAEWVANSDHSNCADWAGGDGVSAIRLNATQLAWFFSDTFIGPAGPITGFSHLSGFAHNAVVVQTGGRQASAFVTVTGGGACTGPGRPGNAAPVVGDPPGLPGIHDRYWDEDGLRTGGTIVKFYNRYAAGTFPFVPLGTVIAVFDASQLSSAGRGSRYGATTQPAVVPLPSYTPPAGGAPILWGAAVLRLGDTVYVYGTQSPHVSDPLRHLYLARVPVTRLTVFSSWRFYAGAGTWATGQQSARPVPLGSGSTSADVSSGFSVIGAGGRYWLIQAGAAGMPDIDAYPAGAPWGPFDFTAGRRLYRDPSIGLDHAHDFRIMYEARAEPALSADNTLVISYNVNSEGVNTGCVSMARYTNTVTVPRFVTVPLAAFGPAAQVRSVRSGPPDDPGIARRNPAQWFLSWSLRHGCPNLPAVTSVRASAGSGRVRLSWPDVGLGVRYLIYLHGPGQPGGRPVTTAYHDGATLTGLQPGSYVARVVPANIRKYTGRGAEVTFTVR
jgi:hypothetical protein